MRQDQVQAVVNELAGVLPTLIASAMNDDARQSNPVATEVLKVFSGSREFANDVMRRVVLAAWSRYADNTVRVLVSRNQDNPIPAIMEYVYANFAVKTGMINNLPYQAAQLFARREQESHEAYAKGASLMSGNMGYGNTPQPSMGGQQAPWWEKNPQQASAVGNFMQQQPNFQSNSFNGGGFQNNNFQSPQPQAVHATTRTNVSSGFDSSGGYQPEPTPASKGPVFDDESDWLKLLNERSGRAATAEPARATPPEPVAPATYNNANEGVNNMARYLNEAEIRAARDRDGALDGYSKSNKPMVFNPTKKTRQLEKEGTMYFDKLLIGSSMDTYENNRMFTKFAGKPTPRVTDKPLEEEVVEAFQKPQLADYGDLEWNEIIDVTDPNMVSDMQRAFGGSPVLNDHCEVRTFALSKTELQMIKRIVESDRDIPTRLLAYIVARDNEEGVTDIWPNELVELFNGRMMDMLRVRLNGSLGPLMAEVIKIEPTGEDIKELTAMIKQEVPSYYERFEAQGKGFIKDIFDLEDEGYMVDQDLLEISRTLKLADGKELAAYTTNYLDLHLPVSSDEIQMEVMDEWNIVQEEDFPEFHALLLKLLSKGNGKNRCMFRVFFSNGLALRVERSWIGQHSPMISVLGY